MSEPQYRDDVAIERWEDDNPSWLMIVNHVVITTSPDGSAHVEREVQVEHRETGEIVSGIGTDVAMALTMISHRLSKRS